MVFEADGGILPIFKAITCKSKIASASFHPFGLQCRHTHMAKYNVISVVCLVMQPGPRGKTGRLARPLHYLLFSKLTFGEDELWRRMRWLRREIRQAWARTQRLNPKDQLKRKSLFSNWDLAYSLAVNFTSRGWNCQMFRLGKDEESTAHLGTFGSYQVHPLLQRVVCTVQHQTIVVIERIVYAWKSATSFLLAPALSSLKMDLRYVTRKTYIFPRMSRVGFLRIAMRQYADARAALRRLSAPRKNAGFYCWINIAPYWTW